MSGPTLPRKDGRRPRHKVGPYNLRTLRVAAAQINVTTDIDRNTKRIARMIRLAARRGAGAIVLPECAITGYPPADNMPVSAVDRQLAARSLKEVRQLAEQHRIQVMVGSIRFSGKKAFNSSYAINPEGRIAAVYDKVQLVHGKGGDTQYFEAGNRFPVFTINGIKCAMLICLDARYPESYRYLARRGVRIIFQLFFASAKKSSWKLPVLEGTLRCRAAENGIFIVAANVSRTPQMVVSRICDPAGVSLAHAQYGREQLIVADLDLRHKGGGFLQTQRKDLLKLVAVRKL